MVCIPLGPCRNAANRPELPVRSHLHPHTYIDETRSLSAQGVENELPHGAFDHADEDKVEAVQEMDVCLFDTDRVGDDPRTHLRVEIVQILHLR